MTRPRPAPKTRQSKRAERALAAEAANLRRTFAHIRALHRGDVAPARPPTAVAGTVNERAIRAKHRKEALTGVARTDTSRRQAARTHAKAAAEREIAGTSRRLAAEREGAQRELDATWGRLAANDPEALRAALAEALEHNEAPAVTAGVRGDGIELAVLVPDPSAVPDQVPVTGPGPLTLRTLTPDEHAAIYRELVCAHLLVALRRAFAAAPGLGSARAVAVRAAGNDAYGRPALDCLLAARFTRRAVEGVRWSDTDASRIVADVSSDLLTTGGGRSRRLEPIDVGPLPGLAALLAKVDAGALTAPNRRPGTRRSRRRPATTAPRAGRTARAWPDVGAARDAGVEWFARRSRRQRAALLAVATLLVLWVIGTLAAPENPTIIDSAGPAVTTTTGRPGPSAAPPRVPEGVPAAGDDTTVVRVIDGDTVEVAGGTRVRLIGVDTPETVEPGTPVQCFGPEATRYANEITPPGTLIRLVYDTQRTDAFGRTLAYVYKLDDGLFVNRAVARNGFALQYTVPPNVAHAEEFRLAVAEARDAGLGLWRSCQSTTTAAPAPTVPVATTAPPSTIVVPSTRPTVAAATPCGAMVSNASPTRNATVTVRITSDYPNAATVATAHYKTTDTTNRSTTDGSGAGTIDFRISSATVGFEVVIDVTVAATSRCQTSFTPRA